MRYLAPALALFLIGAAADPAAAQPFRAREGVRNGQVRSLDQILNGIRRERPGSLADVQGPDAGPAGEPRYRLKWLTPDGRVLWLDTDARTGRVLGVEGEDRGPIPGPGPQRFGGPRFVPRGGPDAGPPGGPPREFRIPQRGPFGGRGPVGPRPERSGGNGGGRFRFGR